MEKSIERWDWIRDLVRSEEQMEESGMVDVSFGFDNERYLMQETLNCLHTLKNSFIDAVNAFNELKTSPLGRIKVYGIAKTQADFMLFRNGFKMVFALKSSGVISIRFNFLGPNQFMPTQTNNTAAASTSLIDENLIEAKKGPFNELIWTFKGQPIQLESAVKYHLSMFIKESSK